MRSTAKTKDGAVYDEGTGEVLDEGPAKRGPFGRPIRSPEETAEAARVRGERAELRRQELAALRALHPACETEDDPPVVWRNMTRLDANAAPKDVLLERDRLSGKGLPGSKLIVAGRYVDGMMGGEPKHYAVLFTTYRGSAGHLLRSLGVAVRPEELRPVACALIEYAERLEGAQLAEETK